MRRILFNEQGTSAYQRVGSVPGGHQEHVGLVPVAGGMPWAEDDGSHQCVATTRDGTPCKIAVHSENTMCHIHNK